MKKNNILINPNNNWNTVTLGNDIVNTLIERYNFINLNTKFINRVFTFNEQLIIQKSLNPTIITWIIWAGKEAAFKACQKTDLRLIFSHRKFEVSFDLEAFNNKFKINDYYSINNINKKVYTNKDVEQFKLIGTIKYTNSILKAIWIIYGNLVHCIAILDKNSTNIHSGCNLYLSNYYENIFNQIKYYVFPINSINYATESLETKNNAKKYLIYNGFDPNIEISKTKILINGKLRYTPPVLSIKNNILNKLEISISHDHGWGAFAYLNFLKLN